MSEKQPMINNGISVFNSVIIVIAALMISSCGEPEAVIKVGPAGPNTGDLIDPLPEGLVPDKTNSRHTTTDLKPEVN